jgi:AbrB family looped-hinge helix DNA binding protein
MTYKVGPKGQVVLPKAIRERLGIEPGDEVEVEEAGDHIEIRPVGEPVELLGLLADIPGGGTDALLAARREDRELEDAKIERLRGHRP